MLYERVIVISMESMPVARIPRSQQLEVSDLGNGFTLVCGRFGYLQIPNVPRTMQLAVNAGLDIDPKTITPRPLFEHPLDSSERPATGIFCVQRKLIPNDNPGCHILLTENAAIQSKDASIK